MDSNPLEINVNPRKYSIFSFAILNEMVELTSNQRGGSKGQHLRKFRAHQAENILNAVNKKIGAHFFSIKGHPAKGK